MALKPRIGLTTGKAIAEGFKRQFVYNKVSSPSGHTIILDHGHPTVNSRLSAITAAGDRALSELSAKNPGDRAYMEAVGKQAAKYLGSATIPNPPIARGEVVSLSTMIDNRAMNPFAANVALAHSLGKRGFDAQVVVPGTKARGRLGATFLVFSNGHFIDPVSGRVYSPESVTSSEQADTIHIARLSSKIPRRFDYDAVRPEAERNLKARAAEAARRQPPVERESPTAERERTMKQIADDNRRSPLPTDILEGRVRAANQKAETRRRLRSEGYDV